MFAWRAKADKEQLEKHDHQVADFLDAVKGFCKAMSVAAKAREKFSPEAIKFTVQRLNALRREIDAFEKDLIAGADALISTHCEKKEVGKANGLSQKESAARS